MASPVVPAAETKAQLDSKEYSSEMLAVLKKVDGSACVVLPERSKRPDPLVWPCFPFVESQRDWSEPVAEPAL